MPAVELKDFARPDEVITFPNGRIDLLHLSDGTVGRMTFQPGWRWSTDEKPIVGTEWCEVPHFLYVASGRVQIKMKDGTETLIGPGSVARLAPGHDAWVVGSEPLVGVDWSGTISQPRKK